ncbi:MAG TPA: hypothetical protein VLJ10_03860 [Candidatus Bathyarchaeia archaeon]|nr:hypothetical protein [Candidatus Bathyarchaeia archaeon]
MQNFDIFYLCILAFFFWRGWTKGILRSIIAPACLLFWMIIGIINYDLNENILEASLITLAGTFFSTLIIHAIFFIGKFTVKKENRSYVFGPSRLTGAAINTLWNGLILGALIILITLLPNQFLGLAPIQAAIEKSVTYTELCQRLIDPFPVINNIYLTISVFKDYKTLGQYTQTREYQEVFSHPQVLAITDNNELMKKFYRRDGISLLNDPRIQSLLKNEDLMKKLSTLAQLIYEKEAKAAEKK